MSVWVTYCDNVPLWWGVSPTVTMSPSAGGVNRWGGCSGVGTEVRGQLSVPSSRFYYEPRAALKNKV